MPATLRRARGLVPLFASLALAGCQCAPLVSDSTRFRCQSDDDCASGFQCRDTGDGLECVKPGGMGGGGGGTGGGSGGGAGGGGGSTNPPDRLGFSTPPRTAYTGTCSAAVVLETQDAMGAASAVSADTVISIASTPAGLGFFAASDCTGTVLSQVTIAGGTSATTLYFSGMTAGDYDVTASASGFIEATQTETLATPPDALAFTTTPPSPLPAGMCLLTTLEARTGTTPTPLIADATVGLSSSVIDGTRFYADSDCASTITTVTIGAGSATTNFFMKPLTGGTMQTITATASFATATQGLFARPVVRRSSCGFSGPTSLADGGTSQDRTDYCSFSPALVDIGHAFVIAQSSGGSGDPSNLELRCRLNTTSQVRCDRANGSSGAGYHFQVAELPRGAAVQRFASGGCPRTLGPMSLALNPPVDPSKSFVLKAIASGGGAFDDEDSAIVFLEDAGVLTLNTDDCNGYDFQVVEWSALTVTRGELDGGIPPGVRSVSLSGLPAVSSNAALVIQPHTALTAGQGTGDPYSVCGLFARGDITSPTEVTFTRGAGVDAGCDVDAIDRIYFERIDFGAGAKVQTLTATLPAGTGALDVTVTPVDVTRTLVLTSSQIANGQGGGESDFDAFDNWATGDATVRTELTNATTVHLRRDRSAGTAVVTFYVVELDP